MAYRRRVSRYAKQIEIVKKRLAEGKCSRCGKHPVRLRKTDGLPATQCEACYKVQLAPGRWENARAKKVRESKIRLGLCASPGCEFEAIPGQTKCDYHRERAAEGMAKIRQARREAGVCSCGDPVEEGRGRCRPCLDAWARSTRLYRAKQAAARLVPKKTPQGQPLRKAS